MVNQLKSLPSIDKLLKPEPLAQCLAPVAEKGRTDQALQQLMADFRSLSKPMIGRIHDSSLLLGLRCLRDVDGFLQQLDRFSVN